MPQCSYPPHWPCHQRRLVWIVTGCLRPTSADNLPILAGIQPAELRRNGATMSPVRRAMEPRHLVHTALTYALGWECTASQIETPICTGRTTAHHFIWQHQKCGALGGSPMECGVVGQHYETPYFHPRHRPSWNDREQHGSGLTASASVGRFRSYLYKWGMASSGACECGAEEQTVDHIVLHCPPHRPPHGLHSLTVLDDETVEWLLNTCPEV